MSNSQTKLIKSVGRLACLVALLCIAPSANAQDAAPTRPLEQIEAAEGPLLREELREEVEEAIGQEAGNAPEKDKYSPLTFNRDLAVWTAAIFLLLVFVLGKFAWGPITKGLDLREQGIADQIAEAHKASEDAQTTLSEYKAQLAQAKDEVRGLLAEARRDSEKTRTEIVDRARVEAAAQHQRAVEQIEAATGTALKTIATESADMAVQLAGRILRAELSPEDHRQLIDQAVSEMSSDKTAS